METAKQRHNDFLAEWLNLPLQKRESFDFLGYSFRKASNWEKTKINFIYAYFASELSKTRYYVSEIVRNPEINAIWITVPNFARLLVIETIAKEVIQKRAKLIGGLKM